MLIHSEHIFCRNCGYALKGLVEPRCPECGTAFDPADPGTMRTSRPWHWRGVVAILMVLWPVWALMLILVIGLVLSLVGVLRW